MRRQEPTGRLGLAALAGMSLPDLMAEAVNLAAEEISVGYCEVLASPPAAARLSRRALTGPL